MSEFWVIGGGIALIAAIFYASRNKMASTDHSVLEVPITTTDTPVSPETAPQPIVTPEPMSTHLDIFCRGIAQFEGANPANNNPGNCRCSPVGYLPKYGKVGCNVHNFAVFSSYELGWEYLQNLVLHRVILHPKWDFYDFFSNYAPSSDGNEPKHYAEWVANYCKVIPTTTLSTFLT